jgi:hypothetical protein
MKKIMQRLLLAVCLISMLTAGISIPSAAATGRVVVAVSADTIGIGDTVKITATPQTSGGSGAKATLTFSYDPAVLTYESSSADTVNGGDGNKMIVASHSVTITLKAVSAGSCRVTVYGEDGVDNSTYEDLTSMDGGGVTINVENTSSTQGKSADNSLSSLRISSGTLSPQFSSSNTSYTATVDNSVTEVSVEAVASNSEAEVVSVTGNTGLKVGDNTVSITVKAGNGTTAVYKIVVTRKGEGQGDATAEEDTPQEEDGTSQAEEEQPATDTQGNVVMIGTKQFVVQSSFEDAALPTGFIKSSVSYGGQEVDAAVSETLGMTLLSCADASDETQSRFFVYGADGFFPFYQIEGNDGHFIVLLDLPEEDVPDVYSIVPMEDTDLLTGYVYMGGDEDYDAENIYTVYAVNESGEEGWYTYDAGYEQYTRSAGLIQTQQTQTASADATSVSAEKEYRQAKQKMLYVILGLLLVIVILLFVILNRVILKRREDAIDDDDDYEYEEEEFLKEYDEPLPQKEHAKKQTVPKKEEQKPESEQRKVHKEREKRVEQPKEDVLPQEKEEDWKYPDEPKEETEPVHTHSTKKDSFEFIDFD